jgi:hypothetical protein
MENILPASARAHNIVLPNGVDVELFSAMDRNIARGELGWGLNERVALFAADPRVPGKRYTLAEAAVEHAREKVPGLRLQVARGVSPDRMPLFMNAADCLLLTSSSEGSPNVVKEALMCNLPVVSTDVGDVAELLAGVLPSYICEASETALCEALVDCLTEPRRSNGRESSTRLDARIIGESLLGIYRELAPGLELGNGGMDPIDVTVEAAGL